MFKDILLTWKKSFSRNCRPHSYYNLHALYVVVLNWLWKSRRWAVLFVVMLVPVDPLKMVYLVPNLLTSTLSKRYLKRKSQRLHPRSKVPWQLCLGQLKHFEYESYCLPEIENFPEQEMTLPTKLNCGKIVLSSRKLTHSLIL